MEILIFKIVVIILLIRVIILSVGHLIIVFWEEATKMAVEEILKDPAKYIRDEHIGTFFTNMIWVMIFISLLIAAFKGNVIIS
jgi:phosphatidylglycerophosphatase A